MRGILEMSLEAENKEWNEYIHRLKAQVRGMDDIIAMAGSSYGLISEEILSGTNSAEGIRQLRTKADKLCQKLESKEFEVAIVGLEKAGKSTFANAMMGNDILPSKPARCTYTVTSIRYGSTNHAEVVFYTHEEFEHNFRENLRIMGIEYADSLSYRTLNQNQYTSLFEKLAIEKQKYYSTTIHEDIIKILENKQTLTDYIGREKLTFTGQELTTERFKNFIENPAYAIAVKEITIHSEKFKNMPEAVIYDVPGFDSPTQMHKEQTRARMNSADVIILVAGADKPSLTGPQLDIFDREADDDGIRFNEKIFVFANKADIAINMDETKTLSDNMNDLKQELRKYRIVDENFLNKRIIPGSAKVSLSKNPVSLELLRSEGIDDGVDKIVSLLKEYYRTERFEIMKKRVNTIQAKVQNMFEHVFESQKVNAYASNSRLSMELFAKLRRNAEKSILPSLNAYKAELTREYNVPNLPITKRLQTDIIETITKERYGVTEDEMINAVNAHLMNNGVPQYNLTEADLREEKYQKMSKDFVNHVVALSTDEHKACDERIIKIFLDGLGIKETNLNYTHLHETVREFIERKKDSDENNGYYRSLVERFSSDLFEILIRSNLGSEGRWNFFQKELSNFYSLAMFDVNRNMSLPIDRQPLYYALLFQDENYVSMQKYAEDSFNEVISIIGTEFQDDMEIKEVTRHYAFIKGEKAVEEIRNKYAKCKDRESLLRRINNELEDLQEFGSKSKNDEKITSDSYNKFFIGKNTSQNEDTIRQYIEKDIKILQQVLQNVALNAINIEKPFLSLETHTIEKMRELLDSDEFDSFLNANISLILSEQFRDIEEEENKRRIKQEICQKIKTILEQMKSSDL